MSELESASSLGYQIRHRLSDRTGFPAVPQQPGTAVSKTRDSSLSQINGVRTLGRQIPVETNRRFGRRYFSDTQVSASLAIEKEHPVWLAVCRPPDAKRFHGVNIECQFAIQRNRWFLSAKAWKMLQRIRQ